MKLGLLADIQEQTRQLRKAIAVTSISKSGSIFSDTVAALKSGRRSAYPKPPLSRRG